MRVEIEARIILTLFRRKRAMCATEIITDLTELSYQISYDLPYFTKGLKQMCNRRFIETAEPPKYRRRWGQATYYTWRREGLEMAYDWLSNHIRNNISTTTTTEEWSSEEASPVLQELKLAIQK